MLPKLVAKCSEFELYIFTRYGFIKNRCQNHLRDLKLSGKNKVDNTTWAKSRSLIGQKIHAENFFVSNRQAGEQAALVFVSHIFT